MLSRWLLFLFLGCLSLAAGAFERPFPDNAKRGKMTPAEFPLVVIDSTLRRLSVGARIWNSDNLIQMPNSLRGQDMLVNYTEDFQGEIDRVWILTSTEAAVERKWPK